MRQGERNVVITRAWSMPSADTFSIPPVLKFVGRWLQPDSVDPFARNSLIAPHRNDLNPETAAQEHMDAEEFCRSLSGAGIVCQTGLFDPPYSPRQISECYQAIGREVGTEATQNARLYKRVRDALDEIIAPGGIILSFGWNSAGMGKSRGYEQLEILLVAHGGAHNDTICVAERKAALPPAAELAEDQITRER